MRQQSIGVGWGSQRLNRCDQAIGEADSDGLARRLAEYIVSEQDSFSRHIFMVERAYRHRTARNTFVLQTMSCRARRCGSNGMVKLP